MESQRSESVGTINRSKLRDSFDFEKVLVFWRRMAKSRHSHDDGDKVMTKAHEDGSKCFKEPF